jgi:uncharacterized repeat protein (TIGR03803 family)
MSKYSSWPKRALAPALFLAAFALRAQTLTTLATFDGPNGVHPYVGLVQGTDGNFYGATRGGESQDPSHPGKISYYPGTIYKISPTGSLTTLKAVDRDNPGGLLQASDGEFYGATTSGPDGDGTIFRISPEGQLKTLDHFCCGAGDLLPLTGLIRATDGQLYGTFSAGPGSGSAFKIALDGTLTTLHTFTQAEGLALASGIIQATDGNFYGTTTNGGTSTQCATNHGCGTVFKMSPEGGLTTLYQFCLQAGCLDGSLPYAGLIQASDGNLYGVTSEGGDADCGGGCGTAFRITLDGALTTLNTLGVPGAIDPQSSLIQATDGNLYGEGVNGIFRMTLSGTLTVIQDFDNKDVLDAPLIQATDGNFYGTTAGAVTGPHPASSGGAVFQLSVGLGPFVKTQTASGAVGSTVEILGNDLTGATGVTFNGTPAASFAVNSSGSAVAATVPAGATTGTVQVTLPGGSTLSSNVPFQVLH